MWKCDYMFVKTQKCAKIQKVLTNRYLARFPDKIQLPFGHVRVYTKYWFYNKCIRKKQNKEDTK